MEVTCNLLVGLPFLLLLLQLEVKERLIGNFCVPHSPSSFFSLCLFLYSSFLQVSCVSWTDFQAPLFSIAVPTASCLTDRFLHEEGYAWQHIRYLLQHLRGSRWRHRGMCTFDFSCCTSCKACSLMSKPSLLAASLQYLALPLVAYCPSTY